MRFLLAGLDVGTTSVKAVLHTVDGRAIAHGRAPTRWREIATGAEADATAIAAAAHRALREALSSVSDVRVLAVGVASMAEAGVLIDSGGQPMSPVIAWHDRRDSDELADLDKAFGADFSRHTGLPLWTQWSLTKHRWMVEHWPQTVGLQTRDNIAEWVVRSLGGSPGTDLSLASRTGWVELASGRPWEQSLDWSGASHRVLRDLVPSGTPAGRVRADHDLAPLRGAVLTVAGHDHQAAAVGVGAWGPGDELDSCGTAEALVRAAAPGLSGAEIESLTAQGITVGWHAAGGKWCVLGATQGGLILQRVRDRLGVDANGLDRLDHLALEATEGSTRIDVDEASAPTWSGSGESGAVWRAATELVTAQARDLSESISVVTGPRADLIVTGGWTHSRALLTAKRAALGRLWRTEVVEAGARGAALLGGLAAGEYADLHEFPPSPRSEVDAASSADVSLNSL